MKLFSIILAMVLTMLATSTATRRDSIVKPTKMDPHCDMLRPKLLAQEGNPGHHEPPPGWNCSREAKDDHKCACHRECKDFPGGEDEDGNKFPPSTQVQEDANCKVYCFKNHCRCPVANCE